MTDDKQQEITRMKKIIQSTAYRNDLIRDFALAMITREGPLYPSGTNNAAVGAADDLIEKMLENLK